ncbi:MAG TPA: hypothetical protein EYG86_04535 [Crocinitomicaceae bacterium]|nr:hypothetical protein [Crocinitomicaceae bacterium]
MLSNFKAILALTVGLFLNFSIFSQITEAEIREIALSGSEQEVLMQSSTLMSDGYLYYSEILTDKLIQINPESSNYNYRKGYLMLEIRKDYVGAIPYFEKAILDTDPNFDMFSTKEKSAPTDAFFHLASCYHLNEDIDKAEEYYKQFQAISKKKSELLPVAELRLLQCTQAKEKIAAPVNVFLKNIGPKINTAYPEYSPVVSLDGSALYFTSRRDWVKNETDEFKDPRINQYPEDVYVSYKDFDSTWTTPIKLAFCQPRRNEATIAISSDERKIYLYEDSTGNGDIYYTDFYHAKFQDIQKLEIADVNTEYWETHCMMSNDKKTFYFVSDRKGGFGGRDIYMLKMDDATGEWSEPINLGSQINSSYDEDSPFISIDNKTLYYSTNGPKSIGGFDIMTAYYENDSAYTEGKNLGYPFNSTNDDIFYTTTLDGRKGYLTSFRKDGYGEKDIYEIYNDYLGIRDVAVLKGLIKTVDDKPIPEDFAINVRLVCVDCEEGNNQKLVYPRLRDGVFMTSLQPCKTYKLEYMNVTDDAVMYEDAFTTLCDTNYQEIYRELLLDVDKRIIIIPEDTLDLDTVIVNEYPNLEFMHYFAYNKNKLTTRKGELKDFVQAVAKQLDEGRPNITVNIYSSASHVPTKTYETNEILTSLRAENMKYDLIAYFEKTEAYKGKVNVVIVTTTVQGPEYEKDSKNKEKYFPYQYVGLKTE